jgi:hypothetical protein
MELECPPGVRILHQSRYSEKIRLRELGPKRKILRRRFENNAKQIHLTAKLKIIDDQSAQPDKQSDLEANRIDGSEVAALPKVGGLFLLLALSRRRRCQPDRVQTRSRGSISECANHGLPGLAAKVSGSQAITTAPAGMLPLPRSIADSFQR